MRYQEFTNPHVTHKVRLKQDSTKTQDWYRKLLQDGAHRFVKIDWSSTGLESAGNGDPLAELVADGDTQISGKLITVDGTGSLFRGNVLLCAQKAMADGNATGAWAATDIHDGVQGAGDGKLKKVDTGGAPGIVVVGGDKAVMLVGFNNIGLLY